MRCVASRLATSRIVVSVVRLSERKSASPRLYAHERNVPRNVLVKKSDTSSAATRSGTSGSVRRTHAWSSARLNEPLSRSSLIGRAAADSGSAGRRLCSESGRIWKLTACAVLGCPMGTTYAERLP